MKKVFSLLVLSAILCACNPNWGALETVSYPINGEWDELEINSAFCVTTSADVDAAQVTLGEKAQQYVLVEVRNGKLVLGIKKPNWSNKGQAMVVIPENKELHSVEIHGASAFMPSFALEGTDVDIEVSGASKFEGTIYASSANIDLSGASKATVTGSASEMELECSGASDFSGEDLLCDIIQCDLSGASRADVTFCGSIEADLSGASKLYYGKKDSDCAFNTHFSLSGASKAEER